MVPVLVEKLHLAISLVPAQLMSVVSAHSFVYNKHCQCDESQRTTIAVQAWFGPLPSSALPHA